jgi:choline dehydrogenase-like flavoprotein
MSIDTNITANSEPTAQAADFTQRVQANQTKLRSELKKHYDFIVCGSGSSGSVVARRLAENPDISVLLLEAGGDDDLPSVMEAGQWPLNLGSDRDWGFQSQPIPGLNGRSISMSMGKVLGGGSSINVMVWARGHKNDWDFFAAEAETRPGAMSQCLISIAASKVGMAPQTQSIAEREGRFSWSPHLAHTTRSRLPCLKEPAQSVFRSSKIRMAA